MATAVMFTEQVWSLGWSGRFELGCAVERLRAKLVASAEIGCEALSLSRPEQRLLGHLDIQLLVLRGNLDAAGYDFTPEPGHAALWLQKEGVTADRAFHWAQELIGLHDLGALLLEMTVPRWARLPRDWGKGGWQRDRVGLVKLLQRLEAERAVEQRAA